MLNIWYAAFTNVIFNVLTIFKEEQNLEDIARIHKNFIPSPGLEIPVRVVVKPPLLALRYPKLHDVGSKSYDMASSM